MPVAPDGILILASSKFVLRPSLAFSCIGSITARHSSSGHQTSFATWYREWNYGSFTEGGTYIRLGGHHIGHWPTFLLIFVFSVPNKRLAGKSISEMYVLCQVECKTLTQSLSHAVARICTYL